MRECLTDNLIKLYLNGNCSDDQRILVENHITECENCRKRLENLRACLVELTADDMTLSDVDQTLSMPPVSACDGNMADITRTLETMTDGYEILGEMPRGGQAAVFRAIQKSTKRVVAVKLLLQGNNAPKIARYRFEKEIELAASLRHPNIVTVFDSGISQGQYFYAMEYIEGMPLDSYVSQHQLSVRETMTLISQVISGVSYAHQKGVIHRDLKPGNILVDKDGVPHILDFGLAKVLDNDTVSYEGSVMMSMEGQVLGTLAYMAPEQAGGKVGDIDVRTDVYSLGVILYKLLTQQFPYEITGSMLEIIKNIQTVEPERLSKVTKVNSEVEIIILKALDKEPQYRYQSSSELLNDIENWLKGYPILAKADNSLYLLYKLVRRHKYTATVIILLMIIIVSFGSFSFYWYLEADHALEQTQTMIESRSKQLEFNRDISRKMSLNFLILALRKNDIDEALQYQRLYEMDFDNGSEVKDLAALLLSNQTTAVIELLLNVKFSGNDRWISDFIMAELLIDDGQTDKALEYSKRSYEYVKEANDISYKWLAELVESQYFLFTKKVAGEKDESE